MKTKHIIILGLLTSIQLHAEKPTTKVDARGITTTIVTSEVPPSKEGAKVDPPAKQDKVQIALLLDTSSSMDGLIDQARSQLWKVVNTFVDARRDGVAPFVEVALYEYGNNDLSVDNNYIRQVQPLTRDLDEFSKKLFSLKTNGGEVLRCCY
jgi:hypothetical protein